LARAQKSPGDLRAGGGEALLILTIGHSTHPIDEFIELLRQHGVERLVDIRTIPRSRRNPQFNCEALAKSVEDKGIGYVHLKELGGLRHPLHDSINTGWRNAGFRGYADYMQTAEFEEALRRLLQLCEGKRCAAMCAEAVPWRCHRSLLADALVARGIPVEHILSGSRRDVHSLTPFARIENGRVIYPEAKGEARRRKAATAQAELEFNSFSVANRLARPKRDFPKDVGGKMRASTSRPERKS
jgi:hypothetical protein